MTPAGLIWISALRVALMGAVGGAINAWLCYAEIPRPTTYGEFEWTIIPAGACHGGFLALVAYLSAAYAVNRPLPLRLALLLAVGCVAGWLSWSPIYGSINNTGLLKALGWPVGQSVSLDLITGLLQTFGMVSAILYAFLSLRPRWVFAEIQNTWVAATCSGIVGSLWFWNIYERPLFCVLHGTIWGVALVPALWAARHWWKGR